MTFSGHNSNSHADFYFILPFVITQYFYLEFPYIFLSHRDCLKTLFSQVRKTVYLSQNGIVRLLKNYLECCPICRGLKVIFCAHIKPVPHCMFWIIIWLALGLFVCEHWN